MGVVLLFQEVVAALEIQPQLSKTYLDINTGKFYLLTEEELGIAEGDRDLGWESAPEWQKEYWQELIEAFDNHEMAVLPDADEIHEYQMMKDFCCAQEDERIQNELLFQIRGSGAFRRFEQATDRFRLTEAWRAFRQKVYEAIAIRWLEDNGIAYQGER